MHEHPQARFIVDTLSKAGFIAYYAGGWVRDFLLQHPSDDIDIATNAPPETIQALFPKTIPLGISFGIVLVLIDHHPYEVATFRQDLDYHDGRRPSRIAFSTPTEDAKRRDFTINGMFYDPIREEVLDYVGGKEDLKKRVIRAIGNPLDRIKEDRLRMIRALRLACRLGFSMEPATEHAIRAHAHELFPSVAIERIVQELEKGKAFGKLHSMLVMLHDFGLLQIIFPALQGLSLQEVKERIKNLMNYPPEAPLIAYLLPLFPGFSETQAVGLCQLLKLSNRDQEFAIFVLKSLKLLLDNTPKPFSTWAHFYANPSSSLVLQIASAHLDLAKRPGFETHHQAQKGRLQRFIERIQQHNPVVTSQHLLRHGIKPGPTMGLFLKEAERISIDQELEEPDRILEQLRQLPEWK